MAENERLFAEKGKSEEAYLKFKEAASVRLLEKERNFTEEAIKDIAKILEAEAKTRKDFEGNPASVEQMLKDNDVYTELLEKRNKIAGEIEKQRPKILLPKPKDARR